MRRPFGGGRPAFSRPGATPAAPEVVHQGLADADHGHLSAMAFILWLLAVVLVIAGIVALVRKEFLYGAMLIIVGLLVGPGGVSIFT